MISFLIGKLEETGKNYVILNVNGVGYRIYMPTKAIVSLTKKTPKVNSQAKFFTRMLFNQHEGVFEIFGFPERDDLEVFDLLISVNGIGPRHALNILSSLERDELFVAVFKEDPDYLKKVSGLGPKTAKRLVIELKDKLDKFELVRFSKLDLTKEGEAMDALVSLGYSQRQAQEALRKIKKKNVGVEEKVKEALRILSGK